MRTIGGDHGSVEGDTHHAFGQDHNNAHTSNEPIHARHNLLNGVFLRYLLSQCKTVIIVYGFKTFPFIFFFPKVNTKT